MAIGFKNYIKKKWPLYEGGVPEPDRLVIKDNLIELMLAAPKRVQPQLIASLEYVAECDFPSDWTNLIPNLKKMLEGPNGVENHGKVTLETMDTVFKFFRGKPRCNELLSDVPFKKNDKRIFVVIRQRFWS